MKKFILSFLCLALVSVAQAQYEKGLLVRPLETTSNDPVATTDKKLTICLDNATAFEGLQFDMYVPVAIDVDYAAVEKGSGLPYTTDRSNNKTYKHTVEAVSLTSEVNGFNHYRVLVYTTAHDAFTATDILSIYCGNVNAPASIYPVYFTNIAICYAGQSTGDEIADQTTYIKVGNPGSYNFKVKGVMSSVLNEALAAESAITRLDLSAVTASNGTFAYVPGREVVAPATDVKANLAASIAPAEGNKYASLCLPFDADINCYVNTKVEDGWATFSAAETLAAGTSAIVDAAVTATASEATLTSVSNQDQNGGYYIKADKFCSVSGTATIPALRGWWNISANVRGFVFDGEETSINSLSDIENNSNATIYSISGVRLNKVQRGINIVGGKKIVVK